MHVLHDAIPSAGNHQGGDSPAYKYQEHELITLVPSFFKVDHEIFRTEYAAPESNWVRFAYLEGVW